MAHFALESIDRSLRQNAQVVTSFQYSKNLFIVTRIIDTVWPDTIFWVNQHLLR